jgi:hypothetical protein
LIERFREVDEEIKLAIAREPSKLKLGLCVLTLAQDQLDTEYLSIDEIVEALDRLGVAVERSNLLRAFARAGDRIRCITEDGIRKYKAMTSGRQEVEEILSISGPQVIYVQDGQPRTARAQLGEVLAKLSGTIRICDPYYGVRSLDVLEMIPRACQVRFLTARTSEKITKLHRVISDFRKEYPHIEFRVYPRPGELHDRYLIEQGCIWFLGHGIKDVGNRESFIIRIDAQIASDLINTLESSFDRRWSRANPV